MRLGLRQVGHMGPEDYVVLIRLSSCLMAAGERESSVEYLCVFFVM